MPVPLMRLSLLLPLALAAGALLVLWLRRRVAVVTVVGPSMLPTFAAGDRVLVRRAGLGQIRSGQVVVIEKPGADGDWPVRPRGPLRGREWMIKRVAAVPGDNRPGACLPESADPQERRVPAGKFVVLGDNPARSYDSRHLGYVPGERLLGIVMRQVARGSNVAPANRHQTARGPDRRYRRSGP